MRKRTVVYVASRLPYPLRSGLALRQFHVLKAYAAIANVELVFFDQDAEALRFCDPLLALCSSLHPVPVTAVCTARRRWQRRLEYFTVLKPYNALVSYSERLRNTVERLAASADLVHVARLHMVPHVEALLRDRTDGPATILDLDEIETVARARWLKAGFGGSFKGTLLGSCDLPRLWSYQRWAVRAFDRVFVCSDGDRTRLGRDNVVVIPNGADDVVPTNRSGSPERNTILYCGQLSWKPNADAALFLVKDIFPRIQKMVKDARIFIVGSAPPAEVRRLDNEHSVFVRADVPSVDEYYEQATLVAVPLRVGGGTRLKILEAFSRRVPVVSTTIGCEGLAVVNCKHLFIEDNPEDFARRCVDLMMDANLCHKLTAAAASLVAERYTWTSIERRISTAALDLLTK